MTTKTKNNLLTQLINNDTENYWAVSEAFNPFRDNIFDKAAEKLEDFTLKAMNSSANHLVNLLSKEGRLSNKMVAIVRHHAKMSRNFNKQIADHVKKKTKELGKDYKPEKDEELLKIQKTKGFHDHRLNIASGFIKQHSSYFSDDILRIARNPGELESISPSGEKIKPENSPAPKDMDMSKIAGGVLKILKQEKGFAQNGAKADSLDKLIQMSARDSDSYAGPQGDHLRKMVDREREKQDRQQGRVRAPSTGGDSE